MARKPHGGSFPLLAMDNDSDKELSLLFIVPLTCVGHVFGSEYLFMIIMCELYVFL